MLEVLAHAVVLGGEEGGVEDDAEGDGRVEEHVVNDDEEHVLKAQPEAVVEAAPLATRPVTVGAGLWKNNKDRMGCKTTTWGTYLNKLSIW